MKIGILGSGDVGRVLGTAFTREGYEVMLGTRDIQKKEVVQWLADNPGAATGSFEEAAKYGELIVFAMSGDAAETVTRMAGVKNLEGKIIIDTTNPIDHTRPPVNGVLPFFTTMGESLMERLQKLVPGAKLVKAFNSVGNPLMYKPDFDGQRASMFICGNDDEAKQTVTGILTAFGWETEDMGKANAAGVLESLCILWCIPGFLRNQWSHAFKLLKK